MSRNVDVLAVMDEAALSQAIRTDREDMRDARAAVAELIAAAADAVERGTDSPIHLRLEAAIARAKGEI